MKAMICGRRRAAAAPKRRSGGPRRLEEAECYQSEKSASLPRRLR